jgi:hypothetical protein
MNVSLVTVVITYNQLVKLVLPPAQMDITQKIEFVQHVTTHVQHAHLQVIILVHLVTLHTHSIMVNVYHNAQNITTAQIMLATNVAIYVKNVLLLLVMIVLLVQMDLT